VRLNQSLTGNISTSTKKVFSKENGKSTARTIQGIPVNPFKKSVGALPDPEQAEESDAPKPRKTRKDAGTTKAPPSAGGEPKKKIRIKKPTPKPPSLSMAEEISGSDADTEGAGYAGDRMVGGLLMRRHMPISFPSVCRKEYNGGSIYLDEANYMPTRFL
jgi:hypothetical protein